MNGMTNNNEAMVQNTGAVQTGALSPMELFKLPTAIEEATFSNEDLAEDMDGLSLFFQRVKIPSGGGLQFEIPGSDPESPDYTKTLQGVILYNHSAGGYWLEGDEYSDDKSPLCSSVDGKVGVGDPGGSCAICKLNEFGSGKGGKGKACKNMRVLYLLQDGEFLPIQLNLSPTSIRPFTDFYNMAFASKRRATFGSVVEIGLKRADNGTNVYSVATFKKLYDFSGEKLAQVKVCSESFREQIKTMLLQRAADTEIIAEDIYSDPDYTIDDNGEVFCITSDTIDGDRGELPA